MPVTPRSKVFDDVYFSREDGLAETRHVFWEGNNLPDAWAGQGCYTIAETGFGTGLNFFAVWDLFEKTAQDQQKLHFISFEKFPLSLEDIQAYLSPWAEAFGAYVDLLSKHYPPLENGCYDMALNDRARLTLFFDDVNVALPKLNTEIDCWFLDGFKPSSNPEMWSDVVFENMARLSRAGTSFATFTAAGFVRRALRAAGFDVRKVPGYGRKREMLVGVYR